MSVPPSKWISSHSVIIFTSWRMKDVAFRPFVISAIRLKSSAELLRARSMPPTSSRGMTLAPDVDAGIETVRDLRRRGSIGRSARVRPTSTVKVGFPRRSRSRARRFRGRSRPRSIDRRLRAAGGLEAEAGRWQPRRSSRAKRRRISIRISLLEPRFRARFRPPRGEDDRTDH